MEKFEKLQQFFNKYVDTGKLPGYSLLISQKGEEIAHLSYGLRDIERNRPIERDTIFRIYSMTKPVTSAALMKLHESGAFKLDDPVENYIPSWKKLKVYSGEMRRKMTIKDLLRHTSGLTYDMFYKHPVDELYRKHHIRAFNVDYTLEELIEKLAEIPLQFSPGEKWNYSISTDVIGYLIEVLSGQSLESFFRENLFEPLDMVDTGFFVPEEKKSRFAACYEFTCDALMDDPKTSSYLSPPLLYSGGGGLVSTIDDYNKFSQMLLGYGPDVLKKESIKLMTTNQLPEEKDLPSMGQRGFNGMKSSGIGYGLGVSVVVDPEAMNFGEYSWGGATSVTFFNDPKLNLSVVFMTQLYPSWKYPIREELVELIYQAL